MGVIQRAGAAKKHVILFLAANPRDTSRLALDREARAIHDELTRSGHRDRFDFVTRWAAEPLDLLRELRGLKPTVVHFSGHGAATPDGLIFEGAQRRSGQVVSPDAFASAVGATGASVRLVVLNACYSASTADALLAHVDCVVGMTGAIHDEAARNFAIGFYGGLGEHESIAAAFAQGQAAIHLGGLPDGDQPQLQVRAGHDAAAIVLAAAPPRRRLEVPCPYPGMRPYTADEAARFHGRDAEVAELIGRLRAGEREIFVIGPSGSGKSSFVFAGVVPRLTRGVAGLMSFAVSQLRPGEHPASRLAALPRAPGAPWLLVVDQLEELFTLASAGERDRFLADLRALRDDPRCVVVLTLRADFFGALMESALWAEHGGQLSRIEISPLRGPALREAIVAPARAVDVDLEPELVERLVADAAAEPGILPLLQEALLHLWDARVDQILTLADYEALGGLAVALARRADATLRRFTPAQTAIARRILLRLISFGEGRSDTRRQQPRAHLRDADDGADFDVVLHAMISDRLLTADEANVDLAHEVMISAWPVLVEWIRSHRVDEQRRRRLEAAAIEWDEHGRGARGLLDEIELAEAAQWRQTESAMQLGQSERVMALIETSRAALTRQRRRRRRLVGVVFGVLVAFVVVVSVLAVDAKASDRARQAQVARFDMDFGRQLIIEGHYQEAVPYLLDARRNDLQSSPLRTLFHSAERHLPQVPALEHRGEVWTAAFSPDGTRVVTASPDRTARIWDVATGRPLTAPLEHTQEVWSAAFSPDGTRVVTRGQRGMQVWNASTGKPVTGPCMHPVDVAAASFSPDGRRVWTVDKAHTARGWDAATGKRVTEHTFPAPVTAVAFSPDGTRVVTAGGKVVQVWDASTFAPVTEPLDHPADVARAMFSPDGTRVLALTRDHTAWLWNVATGQSIVDPIEHVDSTLAVFSPDGTRIATESNDNAVWVWDATTGKPIGDPRKHARVVRSVAFSPDGTRLVTTNDDATARVWDVATGAPLADPLEHQGPVRDAVFSPDGTRVATASADGTARIWDAAAGKLSVRWLEHRDRVWSAVFSADGTRMATASSDKTARIWNAATGALIATLVHAATVRRVAFSRDGKRLVTMSEDDTARVWDAVTGTPITSPLKHPDTLTSVDIRPDGAEIVTSSGDNTAWIWNAEIGQRIIGPLKHEDMMLSAVFSPDGTRVVTASLDHTARVWDATTGKPVTAALAHPEAVLSAVFSPDGTRILTTSDHAARVWDATTGALVTDVLKHQDQITSAAFNRDGTRVVTASADRTARVWDATTGALIAGPLQHQATVVSAAFSADGARVVTASGDQIARVWDAVTGKPLTSPIGHSSKVMTAAFSPDGSRVAIVGQEAMVRILDVGLDAGTVEAWRDIARRSPFVLQGDALVFGGGR